MEDGVVQRPTLDDLDPSAWEMFCRLVGGGAGAVDIARPGTAPPAASSDRDRVYLTRLVDHHRINNIPFLIDHCGLRGKRVIEFGAGTAGLSVALALAGAREVVGVEPVRANHEAGLWRARAYRLDDRIRLHHVPDTAHLPFGDGSFDACVCSSVLQYVPGPEERRALLREMLRVVCPGGLLIVCASGNGLIPGGPHATAWWSNLLPRTAAARGHTRGVTYWEIRRALSPLGAVPFRPEGASRGALHRWRQRALARRATGMRRLARRALSGCYSLCEATLCRWLDAPIEAFMPYIAVAFRAPRGRRATDSR